MTRHSRVVTGGIDTHKDVHVACVIDEVGRILSTEAFSATTRGQRRLLSWMRSFGDLARVGVEGTGAYGAGLGRFLTAEGIQVIEVSRPNRQLRRRRGKSDTVDAEAAARTALNGEATVVPKTAGGIVESIRVIRIAFTSARNSRTRVANQIRDLIVTASEKMRTDLGQLRPQNVSGAVPDTESLGIYADPNEAMRATLKTLSVRYQVLSAEMEQLEATLGELTARANPALRGARGVGVDVASILLVAAGDNPERLRSESAFAAMCGVSPVEASSGKIVRHRLNRSGNRQANHALWRIVMVRLTCDRTTKEYMDRRIAEGKSQREVIRCLKRHLVREVFRHLTQPATVPFGPDLRVARKAAGLPLQFVADALGTWPIRISELERSRDFDTDLARRYEALLQARIAA